MYRTNMCCEVEPGKEKPGKPKTVTEILDDVCTEICSHYCKYPEECEKDATGDEDLASEMLSAYCDKCPLMKL